MRKPGNTKLVEIKELSFNGNRFFAKDESSNPSGSIKDRTVFNMLESYRKDGTLVPGGVVIEATSGNTGIGLSFYQNDFNYKAIIVMPSTASENRRTLISKYGAELVLVQGGMKECKAKVQELLTNTPNSFEFNQFVSKYNPESHVATANELKEQLDKIDFIFAGIGTGGTISGIGKEFQNTSTKVIGIEPEESPLITKGISGPHKIEGIGANFIPQTLSLDVVDKVISVKSEDASNMRYRLNSELGFYVGISSGAALYGALDFAKKNNLMNQNIVVIFPDKGDRYNG